MERVFKSGWIEIICGPMFAGKSEELIRRVKRLEYAKKKTLVFKPEIDNRYSDGEIVSHSKLKTKSRNIASSSEILDYYRDDVEAVVIDEVQFLDEGIIRVCNRLADLGVRVIVAGLDRDFRGIPFKNVPELMALADDVTKLTAICVHCGAPATMTQRMVDGVPAREDEPLIVVGATEHYEPRCRHCHELLKVKK